MRSILHITPHLGGGVGRVLLNYLEYTLSHGGDRHSLVCLDYANERAAGRAAATGIPLRDHLSRDMPALLRAIADADLVLIHWWNHPLLYALLIREPLPPARVLIWSHVSGHTPTQNFTDPLLKYPDLFVVSTPYSMDAPAVRGLDPAWRDARVRLVFSCAGIDHVASVRPQYHRGFRVGYVGTVDYCKMHPNFIRMSAAVDVPDICFIVCGGPREAELSAEAERAGVGEKFEFKGHVADPRQDLSTFDVFGYPLAPGHYGTGEQALIEALACGVPPVVLDNGPESIIVENGVTGIIAGDEASYTQAVEALYHHPDLRSRLSHAARLSARKRFTIEKTARDWDALYAEAMLLPKRGRCRPTTSGDRVSTPAELFIEALGEHGADYAESYRCGPGNAGSAEERIAHKEGLFRAETRGSAMHYLSFFPDDPYLNFWCDLMRSADGEQRGCGNDNA